MRALLVILSVLATAYALSYALVVPANPEIAFWEEAVLLRQSDLAEIRKNQPNQPVILFTGGSSCAFSIDPAIIEQKTGLPAINLGLPVACGHGYIIHQALRQSRPGDFLVLCLEPDLLTFPITDSVPSSLSFRLASALGHASEASGSGTVGIPLSPRDYLTHLRPGARYLLTLGAREYTGKGYRYKSADLRYHGRIETLVADPTLVASGPNAAITLTSQGRAILASARDAAQKLDVRVAYSMPWVFTNQEHIGANRRAKQSLLREISTILPILDDGYSGVSNDPTLFSDSVQHLNARGAAMRSEALALPLADWVRSNEK